MIEFIIIINLNFFVLNYFVSIFCLLGNVGIKLVKMITKTQFFFLLFIKSWKIEKKKAKILFWMIQNFVFLKIRNYITETILIMISTSNCQIRSTNPITVTCQRSLQFLCWTIPYLDYVIPRFTCEIHILQDCWGHSLKTMACLGSRCYKLYCCQISSLNAIFIINPKSKIIYKELKCLCMFRYSKFQDLKVNIYESQDENHFLSLNSCETNQTSSNISQGKEDLS